MRNIEARASSHILLMHLQIEAQQDAKAKESCPRSKAGDGADLEHLQHVRGVTLMRLISRS
jgi:hypothetical protein